MQDRGFNSFASNMIKLSVNEIKWSSLLASTRALILYISIWKLISGPKSYRDFRQTGPMSLFTFHLLLVWWIQNDGKTNKNCKQGANRELTPCKADTFKVLLQYLATVLGLSCQKEAYTILQDELSLNSSWPIRFLSPVCFQANLSLNSSCW